MTEVKRLRAQAIVDVLPANGFKVTITSPDLPVAKQVYTLYLPSGDENEAARRGIALFTAAYQQ